MLSEGYSYHCLFMSSWIFCSRSFPFRPHVCRGCRWIRSSRFTRVSPWLQRIRGGTSLNHGIWPRCSIGSNRHRGWSCHICISPPLRCRSRVGVWLATLLVWSTSWATLVCGLGRCSIPPDRWGRSVRGWRSWRRLVRWGRRCVRGLLLGFGRCATFGRLPSSFRGLLRSLDGSRWWFRGNRLRRTWFWGRPWFFRNLPWRLGCFWWLELLRLFGRSVERCRIWVERGVSD